MTGCNVKQGVTPAQSHYVFCDCGTEIRKWRQAVKALGYGTKFVLNAI
jgi:hypothetical protein